MVASNPKALLATTSRIVLLHPVRCFCRSPATCLSARTSEQRCIEQWIC